MSKDSIKVSKFLSYILRHKPDAIGLELDPEGWALIQDIIDKADMELSATSIERVVRTSDKQRFALSPDELYIRANQGHSIKIDLGLSPVEPPEYLYHGTATRFLESIMEQGLLPQNRQYVHLSSDYETAASVGQRHGKPVVLKISAIEMHTNGYEFFQSQNGVWLVAGINTKCIKILPY